MTGTMTAPAEGTAADPNKIVTILSPKGGAGKTSVGTNLAVGLAARHPRQVVLIDLDLQFGDVANVLRLAPKNTIADISKRWPVDSANLKLALTAHPCGLYTLCAPLNPAEADDVAAEHVAGVLQMLRSSFRYVVVDTDPGLSERVLSALDLSADIVMVCSPEMPSIRGLRKALDALDLVGLTDARRHFLLNRADSKVGLEVADIERSIGADVDVKVPSSIDMVKATNEGVPVMESRSSVPLTSAFDKLVDLIDDTVHDDGGAERGRRLFKRKA